MKIIADKEAIQLLEQTVNLALKAAGIGALKGVNLLLSSIEPLAEEPKPEIKGVE